MSLLKEKFDWVKGELDSWKLTQDEKRWLLGGEGIECAIPTIEQDSKAAKNLEARFDAIHQIKETLDAVYNGDIEAEIAWLRTEIDPFQGKSPLEFIRDSQDPDIVSQVARAMEGP